MDRRWLGHIIGGIALGVLVSIVAILGTSWIGSHTAADAARNTIDPAVRPAFREPVTLASKDGVLEVRLIARQGEARLDTVAKPVEGFLLFSYELVRGTASNGETAGDNLYPAPTLKVDPGETLIVHLENALSGLTIRDFYNPRYTAKGQEVPLYPEQMTSSPINLHTHGLRVSPKGNGDNVLLHVAPGLSNTYTYRIPKDHPQGAYWYHPHLHTLTSPHVYYGLAGLLAIGRLDGNLPLVTRNKIPIRAMVLQDNFVFDRKGGLAQLSNPAWPQFVSTLTPPKGDELAKGIYRPLLAPVNFKQSRVGTKYSTIWYAGPLSIENNRGRFEYIPSNLKRFTANSGNPKDDLPDNPSLPDHQRDVQFTVNGQFQPVINSKAGQTEIWVLANVSDLAYITVQLTEAATGRHPKIAIVGQDGNPAPAVHHPVTENGTRLVIPPASRFAIAVTMPQSGDLILEMPPSRDAGQTLAEPGVLYTNDGSDNPPAVLGRLSMPPSAVSYEDGFFVFPTQVLARAVASGGTGVTTAFTEGQTLDAETPFEDLSKVTPDVTRRLVISGGFINDLASKADPKSFVYAFDGTAFPYVPLIQPRLNSVEEWTFINNNNDEHPIHVHVNDFQVTKSFDPRRRIRIGPEMWGVDNINVAAPTLTANEEVIQPGTLSMRTRFLDFTGLFVLHCHRLNHEDNGLMALVNIIPAVSSYAVAVPGAPGRAAVVHVHDGKGDRLIATVTPFAGFEGTPSVAMGDVDGDSVLDLIVGAGKGHAPEVVAYSGAANGGKAAFATELARFSAFAPEARDGVSVTATQIDGKIADNIIVGSGPGIPSEVKVFSSDLPASPGATPALFSSFKPYADDRSGVSVASGFVDFVWGRNSIVTAPGFGRPAEVKVFSFPLMTPNKIRIPGISQAADICTNADGRPVMSASFMPFGKDYRGGLSLATGWLFGPLGGARRIVVGQLTGAGEVKVYSSGSALQGGPDTYLENPMEHSTKTDFVEAARFTPLAGGAGVRVATTSTTTGADLIVSGIDAPGGAARVLKFDFIRTDAKATTVEPVRLGDVLSSAGSVPFALGGD